MKITSRPPLNVLIAVLTVAILGVIFYLKAQQNFQHQDYINSNFFSFWLSGRMVWTGESPYDTTQWLHGFDAYAATYRPSQILQYPLPLMFFMAPVGLLPVGQAYFAWQIVTLCIIAFCVYALLRHEPSRKLLFLPLMLFLMFFGPVYLTLEIGSVGAISLLAVTLTIVLLGAKKPLLAGMALSLTLLKPPQALTLLFLGGIWLLTTRQWKALAGMVLGGLVLLVIWMVRDPLGLEKFRGSSGFLLGHTLGIQSNVFGFSYLACGQSENCMWIVGSAALVLILALGTLYIWRYRSRHTAWEAFNIIIPLGFVSALYLYSYDQLLYVIPIVWITARLLERLHSYIPVFAFLIVLDLVSFAALAVQATTHKDLLSIVTTLLVLGMCLWLVHGTKTSPLSVQPSASAPATNRS
jgi:glycosyl transferase family 87